MYQKLQRNFDIIQYLVKDASPEQLKWRNNEQGQSLGEVLCRLRDVERWHACVQVSGFDVRSRLASAQELKNSTPVDDEYAFTAYACYRQQTMAWLQKIPPVAWSCIARHQLFGKVTLAELVEKIDQSDQTYIRQIENIIHRMPLNPLFERALYEISDYYRCYQVHLAQAVSLLDIGVGTGLALRHVMRQNPHLNCEGVDVRDLRLPRIDVPLEVYNGRALPFAANQFDVSLMFYVIHHCENPQCVLNEAIRVTRQKLIIIEEFHQPGADETSLDLTERQSHRALGIPPDLPYRLFDQPEFEAMLRERNLVEVERKLLPSKTTRPVQKYLYVVLVNK